ncbi:MAG: hypothetical protein M1829_004591, partial [Trizodia sp. TS-e1964]
MLARLMGVKDNRKPESTTGSRHGEDSSRKRSASESAQPSQRADNRGAESIVSSASVRRSSRAGDREYAPSRAVEQTDDYSRRKRGDSVKTSSQSQDPSRRDDGRREGYSEKGSRDKYASREPENRGDRQSKGDNGDYRSSQRSSSKDRDSFRKDRKRDTKDSRDLKDYRDDRTPSRVKDRSSGKARALSAVATEDKFHTAQDGYSNIQATSPAFTQFPGQYAGSSIPAPSTVPPKYHNDLSSHVPDMFPGQFPTTTTSPYRPPGLAADYYGDQGESVADQPGVRPNAPEIIFGAQPHLQAASAVAAPPIEPSATGGVGAAASFYSDDFATSSTVITSADKPTKPSKPTKYEKPNSTSSFGISQALPAIAGSAALVYAASSSPNAANLNATYSKPPSSAPVAPPDDYYSRPSGNDQRPPSSVSIPPLGAIAAGAAIGASAGYMVGATDLHHDHDHHQSSQTGAFSGQFKLAQTSLAHRRRGPLTKFIDFWKDPNGVAEFEEYSEYIGVCRGCFEPGSSPRDAPRKHSYRRRSSDRPGSRSSIRVEKRYESDSDKKRRNSKSWISGGLASYGIANIGKSLWRRRSFQSSQSVLSGRDRSTWSIFGNDSNPSFQNAPPSSHGITRRSSMSGDERRYSRTAADNYVRHRSRSPRLQKYHSQDKVGVKLTGNRKDKRKIYSDDSIPNRNADPNVVGLALVGGGAALATSSFISTHKTRKSRSKSPKGEFVRTSSKSSKNKESSSFFEKSSRSGRITTSTPSGNSVSFQPISGTQRKKKGFFNLSNSSTSSGETHLAYGPMSSLGKKNLETDAAILNIGSQIAKLSEKVELKNGRNKPLRKSKGAAELIVVKESSNPSQKTRTHLPDPRHSSSASEEDPDWATDREEELERSHLAYGPYRKGSRESLTSEPSGTEKWSWRWGSKRNKKSPRHNSLQQPGYQPTLTQISQEGVVLGNADLVLHSRDPLDPANQPIGSITSINPKSIEMIHDKLPQNNSASFSETVLQQPQPILPVLKSVYHAQAPTSGSFVDPLPPLPALDTAPPHDIGYSAKSSAVAPKAIANNEVFSNQIPYSNINASDLEISKNESIPKRNASPNIFAAERELSPTIITVEREPPPTQNMFSAADYTFHGGDPYTTNSALSQSSDPINGTTDENRLLTRAEKGKRDRAKRRAAEEQEAAERAQVRAGKRRDVSISGTSSDKGIGIKSIVTKSISQPMIESRQNVSDVSSYSFSQQKLASEMDSSVAATAATVAGAAILYNAAATSPNASVQPIQTTIRTNSAQMTPPDSPTNREYSPAPTNSRPPANSRSSSRQRNAASRAAPENQTADEEYNSYVEAASTKWDNRASDTFFLPPELVNKSGKVAVADGVKFDGASDFLNDLEDEHPPQYSAGDKSYAPSRGQLFAQGLFPWPVPSLKLIKPTPPGSVAGSVKGEKSAPPSPLTEPINAGSTDNTDVIAEELPTAKGSQSEHKRKRYEEEPPISEPPISVAGPIHDEEIAPLSPPTEPIDIGSKYNDDVPAEGSVDAKGSRFKPKKKDSKKKALFSESPGSVAGPVKNDQSAPSPPPTEPVDARSKGDDILAEEFVTAIDSQSESKKRGSKKKTSISKPSRSAAKPIKGEDSTPPSPPLEPTYAESKVNDDVLAQELASTKGSQFEPKSRGSKKKASISNPSRSVAEPIRGNKAVPSSPVTELIDTAYRDNDDILFEEFVTAKEPQTMSEWKRHEKKSSISEPIAGSVHGEKRAPSSPRDSIITGSRGNDNILAKELATAEEPPTKSVWKRNEEDTPTSEPNLEIFQDALEFATTEISSPAPLENQSDYHQVAVGQSTVEKNAKIPEDYGEDLDFAATLAAGLKESGFDDSIVINDPLYRIRHSPPGSDKPMLYHAPFAETVTDIGVFREDGLKPDGSSSPINRGRISPRGSPALKDNFRDRSASNDSVSTIILHNETANLDSAKGVSVKGLSKISETSSRGKRSLDGTNDSNSEQPQDDSKDRHRSKRKLKGKGISFEEEVMISENINDKSDATHLKNKKRNKNKIYEDHTFSSEIPRNLRDANEIEAGFRGESPAPPEDPPAPIESDSAFTNVPKKRGGKSKRENETADRPYEIKSSENTFEPPSENSRSKAGKKSKKKSGHSEVADEDTNKTWDDQLYGITPNDEIDQSYEPKDTEALPE